jgi:hypothetical protein
LNAATPSAANIAACPLNVAIGLTFLDKLALFCVPTSECRGIVVEFSILSPVALLGLPNPLPAGEPLGLCIAGLESDEPNLLTLWGVKVCRLGWVVSQPGAQMAVNGGFTM